MMALIFKCETRQAHRTNAEFIGCATANKVDAVSRTQTPEKSQVLGPNHDNLKKFSSLHY